ncbi:AraC family transcriptional regulator [Acidobacteria bacterium AB60]|nr:AraC family transcriptional regulator [Acidobacteria bacterium AB60]
MSYAEFVPHPGLRGWVKCLWTIHEEPSDDIQEIWPDGCIELLFSLGNHLRIQSDGTAVPIPSPAVLGLQTGIMRVRTAGEVRLLAARLLPVGVPDWDPAELQSLDRKIQPLLASPDTESARSLLESWLLEHPLALDELAVTLRTLVENYGNISVAALAGQRRLSVRQLQREFHERLGISPKNLSIVLRFARSWSVLLQNPDISLADLALELGFTDQAHFTHAFGALGGESPRRFAQIFGKTSRSYKKRKSSSA